MRPLSAALLCLTALAGCASPTETEGPDPIQHSESFDGLAAGATPDGWAAQRGTWGASGNASDAGHPSVLRGAGEADPGLSSLIAPGAFTDFEASVSFKMVSGEHPQGAGLAFHFADDKNYQIIRYSISENGWHLFTVIDGNRQKQGDASVAGETHPQANQWVDLHVTSTGGHVLAFDGSTKVIDYLLPTDASRSGGVGPFVRGNTVALFDDFKVA